MYIFVYSISVSISNVRFLPDMRARTHAHTSYLGKKETDPIVGTATREVSRWNREGQGAGREQGDRAT